MDLSIHLKKLENLKFPIELNDLKMYETKGIKLYKNNPCLRDIATFMEHPESYQFYQKYLKDPENLKIIMSYLKIYDLISRFIKEDDINAYHKIFIFNFILTHPIYRPIIHKILTTDNKIQFKLNYINNKNI